MQGAGGGGVCPRPKVPRGKLVRSGNCHRWTESSRERETEETERMIRNDENGRSPDYPSSGQPPPAPRPRQAEDLQNGETGPCRIPRRACAHALYSSV